MSERNPREEPARTATDDLAVLLAEGDARERVFEALPDAVLLTDMHGHVRDANRAALALLARPAEDVFGRPIGDLVVEDPARAGAVTGLTRAGLWQGRVAVLRPDGGRVALLGRSIVIAGEDEPMHLLVLGDRPSDPVADALAAAEQRLAAIVDSATDAIVSMDRTHRIVIFNAAAQEMFGYAAADVVGRPFERFIAEPHRAGYREYLAGFAADRGAEHPVGAFPAGLMAVRADGEEFPIEATVSRVDGPDGSFLTVTVRDVTERQRLEAEREQLLERERLARAEANRIQARTRKLQALTDAALTRLSLDDLFRELLGRLRELLASDSATVLLLEEEVGMLHVHATDGLRRDADDMHDVPFGKGLAGRIAAEARPLVIEDLRQYPSVSAFLRRRLRSLAGVPIVHEGSVKGVLHVGTLQRRTFTDEDVALLQIVAARLAPAIENARLHQAEREARATAEAEAARLRVSGSLAEALSHVPSMPEMAGAVVEHIVPALGAIAGVVGVVDRERGTIRIEAFSGYDSGMIERFQEIPIDADLPLSRAVRDGRPVLLGSVAERDATFADLAGIRTLGGAWAAVPLLVDEEPIGVLGLSFEARRHFEAADVALMTTLAHQSAQALDRSLLYERERRGREQVEQARTRLALLQTLTARLSRSLTGNDVAEVVVTQASAALGATSSALLVLDEAGGDFELRTAHGYSAKALEGWDRFPADPSTPAGQAARSGQLVVVASGHEMRERFPSLASSIQTPDMGPTVAVPILLGERPIGVIAFTFPVGRGVGEEDRELLSAIGRHAGQALERADLYENERLARREAERARERTERLRAVTAALARADTTTSVLDVLVDQSLAALGAIAAIVVRPVDGEDELESAAARGYPAEVTERWKRFSVDAEGVMAEVARERRPVWIPAVDETVASRYPVLSEAMHRLGHRGAFAGIPIQIGGRLLGVIGLQFAEQRDWQQEDRELLSAIAAQCAQAWSRAALHDAEIASRAELRRSERRYRSLVQATSAVDWTVDPAGAFVDPQPSWESYTGQGWEQHRGFGWVEALHPDDRPVITSTWFQARDAQTLFEAEGRIWHAPSDDYHHVIVRAAPVRDDRGSIVEWVGTVTDVHEQRLAEAASSERERSTLASLELASERLSFLAEASAILASSLVVHETLRRLADIVVPRLADWCAIDMVGEDGGIELVAVSHADPAKVEMAWELRRRFPTEPDAPTGVPAVLRTGRPELIAEIPPEILEAAAERDPELGRLVGELQLRSAMIVPIRVAERVLGAITFIFAESGRTYTGEHLALAEDLAHRAAIAVENGRLYEAEQTARLEEEEAQRRLRILAEAGAAMTASLDTRVIVSAVTRLAAREVSDWAAVFLTGPTDDVVEAIGAHRDPRLDGTVQRVITARFPSASNPDSLVGRVLRTGAPVVATEVTEEQLQSIMAEGEQLEHARRIGFRSVVVVPLSVRGRSLGALVTVRSPASPAFDDDDAQLILELGRRAALALENARLYGEREYVAETLQRSLLPPDLPPIPGLEIGARYEPASEGTSVGGDFYDVFEIDPGHWAAVIGDVVGKGPPAAAMMGLARYTIRTAAMGETRPSRILGTLNEAIVRQTSEQRFCTACCLRILRGDQRTRVTVSSGGHPLPIALRADGTLHTVGSPGTLLGVFEDPTLVDEAIDLGPGDALVLYTDGVTDERRGDEEFGEQRLVELLSTLAGRTAQEIADAIIDEVVAFRSGQPRDDIALLVLRVAP
ncbi:MAG TPA: GAF domain-containing protein [Actinomycetota bacterium]|nr:GAF domain-containing protein [Actinomycetota bacterium]